MAEWLRNGLQNRVRRFNSGSDLILKYAAVMKLVYIGDLKSPGSNTVWVRVPPAAHIVTIFLSLFSPKPGGFF